MILLFLDPDEHKPEPSFSRWPGIGYLTSLITFPSYTVRQDRDL